MSISNFLFNVNHESDSHAILNLSGDLTIEHSSSIHEQLLQQDYSTNKLSIVIQNVKNIDLSFIQLLIGYIQHRNQSHKQTYVEFDIDNPTLELLEKTGCIETINSLQSMI
jgi:anti-anti-sigma regulatory factor